MRRDRMQKQTIKITEKEILELIKNKNSELLSKKQWMMSDLRINPMGGLSVDIFTNDNNEKFEKAIEGYKKTIQELLQAREEVSRENERLNRIINGLGSKVENNSFKLKKDGLCPNVVRVKGREQDDSNIEDASDFNFAETIVKLIKKMIDEDKKESSKPIIIGSLDDLISTNGRIFAKEVKESGLDSASITIKEDTLKKINDMMVEKINEFNEKLRNEFKKVGLDYLK
jgi:hypothetical protein